jgi:hypothetical protein
VFVQWSQWDELRKRLDTLKEAAQGGKGVQYLEAGEDKWAVSHKGYRLGGASGPMYKWVLSLGGFRIGIQDEERPKVNADVGNVWLQIGSEMLMSLRGLRGAFEYVRESLGRLGGTVVGNKVSRVDACVDLPGIEASEFTRAFREGRVICRAQKWSDHGMIPCDFYGCGRKETGLSLGTVIRLRAYDKVAEVRNNPTKKAILETHRWGGKPEIASRVEFQIRREALKEFGVDTVEDWEKEKASILRYLCEDWFRLTEYEVDRTNTTRGSVSEVWRHVTDRFMLWCRADENTRKAERETPQSVVEPDALVKQARGCLTTAVAALGLLLPSAAQCRSAVEALLFGGVDWSEWRQQLAIKRDAFLAAHPGGAFVTVDEMGECSG